MSTVYLTPEQVAQELLLKVGTVWGWIRRKKLGATKLSQRRYLIARATLDDFLAKRTSR